MDRVILCLHQKCRRRLRCYLNRRIRLKVLFCRRQVGWINDDREVRPTTHLVGGIDGGIDALIEVRAQCGGQVSSRGKAQYPDPIWVDMPCTRMFAHHAERALRIL